MYIKRDNLIRKQILKNKRSQHYQPLQQQKIKQLQIKALQQLSLHKINSREIDYTKIQLFIFLAEEHQKAKFYSRLNIDLRNIFNDQKSKKTFEQRWNSTLKSNVMRLFTQIAEQGQHRQHFVGLYTDTIIKLLKDQKLSRVQQKFLDPFLTQQMKNNKKLQIVGQNNLKDIHKQARIYHTNLSKRQTPKSLTNCQFLCYSVLNLLQFQLPHEKYLSNQLLHAPNPKYLLPFRKKGTFTTLTNQILLKLNKVDMVSIKYWSYYQYQQCDVYQRIRKAAGWQNKVDILLLILKSKLKQGLIKYLNHINQKAMLFSNKNITDDGINLLNSYVQISLEISYNIFYQGNINSRSYQDFQTALEKVDIGHAFQLKKLTHQSKLKQFILKLIQLYLLLLKVCSKKSLRQKFVGNIAINICKLIQIHNQEKFKNQMISLVIKNLYQMENDQKTDFLFTILQYTNKEWQSKQEVLLNNQIAKIDPNLVSFLASLVEQFGLQDNGNAQFKVLKLQFFYIMALNYKQNSYFQSKKLLSRVPIDINSSISNNRILSILKTREKSYEQFKMHLKSLYGDYQLSKSEHEGILAVIDQVVTYRIQSVKDNPQKITQKQSFYSLLVNLLEQAQRLDPSSQLLDVVLKYFLKFKKTYIIETLRMKFRDQSKEQTKQFITQEICFLIEGSASANPIIAQFCQGILFQHIEAIPQLGFYTKTLVVFAQCISALYKKQSQQYESKAQRIKGKYLTQTILIPNNNKQVVDRMIKIMTALYQVILRAHCIDSHYLKVRGQYLIRQHSKSSQIPFGWKLLKHMFTAFKDDKDFIMKEVLNNNSCSWFINQEYFSQKVRKLKPQNILLDKNLNPLHNENCDKGDLKKIMLAVQPQVQSQFLIVPLKSTKGQRQQIIRQLKDTCLQIQTTIIYQPRNTEHIEKLQNSLYDTISRVKMVYLNKMDQAQMTSKLLQVCRRYNNSELLKYCLTKIIPFFYCLKQFNQLTLSIIAQFLNNVVNQINCLTRLVLQKNRNQQQDTFDVSLNCFDSLQEYQRRQDSQEYYKLLHQYSSTKNIAGQRVRRFMIIRLHKHRMLSYLKMYMSVLKFLNSHLHVSIAKGIPLTAITQVFSINFQLNNQTLQFLPLESIGHCLTSHLQLINVLKASLEKGQTLYDEGLVDQFYFKTLKFGLLHFQKRKTWYQIEIQSQSRNIKSKRNKIDFFIRICDYLRNDDFHKISKKKLPKRNQIFKNKKDKSNPLLSLLQFGKNKKSESKDLQLSSKHQSITMMRNRNSNIGQTFLDLPVLRYSLLYLISQQIDRTKSYSFTQLGDIINPYSLSHKKKFITNSQIEKLNQSLGGNCNVLIFYIIKQFGNRIQDPQKLLTHLREGISVAPDYGFPEFLDLFIQRNKKDMNKLKEINFWKAQNIQILFKYLTPQYQEYPYLQLYVTKVLNRLHSSQILFYLPQIFQALTLETGKIIYAFLLNYARKSASFAHQLIWISKVQSKQQRDPHNKNPRLPGVDNNLAKLQRLSSKLIKDTIRQFTRQEKSFFREVDDFYEQITAISGIMQPKMASSQKKQIIRNQVIKIKAPKSVYLPINPIYQVVSLNTQSGTPMQSAAKCPFLLTFNCTQYCGPDQYFQAIKRNKRNDIVNDFQFDLQEIREEQIPQRVPQLGVITVGSRIKNSGKSLISNGSLLANGNHNEKQRQSFMLGNLRQKSQYSYNNNQTNAKNSSLDINAIKLDIGGQKRSMKVIPMQNNSDILRKDRSKQNSTYFQNSSTITQVSCIFKVFDDIRQDSLALQVIRLFMEIYQRHNLDLKLFPYKTISNRTGSDLNIGGIIQVVPKTVSRDSIGKTNQESLYEFFINNFGPQYNINFQTARQNFIRSQAAYSIISYILQIKDRHNGNILINKQEGYLVHIDFGFIFDISPANNLRFQRADFKLTQQMIKIMGGKIDSQPFQLYLNLVIKGFLIARKYNQHIVNLIKQMFRSGLPCFLEKSIQNLKSRFVLQMSEIQAAQHMKNIVLRAADHWTTNWYDRIQWIQQKIYH